MRIFRNQEGVAAIEFALVAPVLLLILLGGLEIGYEAYLRAILRGEMNRTSRDQTLEGSVINAQRTALEDRMRAAIRSVSPGATIDFKRTAYRNYTSAASKMEDWVDANGNGKCDSNEVYQDENRNGIWDASLGKEDAGGGAKDVVVYTANLTYPKLPIGRIFNATDKGIIEIKTLLRNQPYDNQSAVSEKSCS